MQQIPIELNSKNLLPMLGPFRNQDCNLSNF